MKRTGLLAGLALVVLLPILPAAGARAAKHEQAVIGEDSMGFNLMMYAYGGIDVDEMIRGRLDYMRNCCMGGWHLMDMRRECDWSDPYVLGGGIARASRQAFIDRTN